MSQMNSITLSGVYDTQGLLTLSDQGTVPINLQITYQNNQKNVTVYIGGQLCAQVTFGLNGQRWVSSFLQGFGDEQLLLRNVEYVLSASGC